MLRVEAGEAVTRRPVDVENRTEGEDGPLRRVFYVGVFFLLFSLPFNLKHMSQISIIFLKDLGMKDFQQKNYTKKNEFCPQLCLFAETPTEKTHELKTAELFFCAFGKQTTR